MSADRRTNSARGAFLSQLGLGGIVASATPFPRPPGRFATAAPSPPPIAFAVSSVAAFLGTAPSGPTDTPTSVASLGDFIATFGAANASTLGAIVGDFFANGGARALVVRLASADAVGDAASRTGISALAGALAVSAAYAVDATPAQASALLGLCSARGAMAMFDAPSTTLARVTTAADLTRELFAQSPTALAAQLRNAVVYTPRLTTVGPFHSPCGAVAGVWARTDAARGVWKSPAGTDATFIGCVLERAIDVAADAKLAALGINTLRAFAGGAPVVWGARTLDAASGDGTWRYLSVRRLALALQSSIASGLAFAAFEKNDATLWSRVRLAVDTMLQGVFRAGAFVGTTPAQAYFVKCDATTTTANDRARGIVNVLVGFAPLRPAEFVVLTIAVPTGRA